MTEGGAAPGPLWRNRDFLYLLFGQSVSLLGSAFSTVAIPLVAVLTLRATALQTSLVTVVGGIAWFAISLLAGVWLDRVPRRPVLVASDLLRGVILLAIPIAFLLHGLSLGVLYLVAFLVGWGSVLFEIGYQSYLPTLVHRDDLVRANSWEGATYTVATAAGPAVAGALISAFGAPLVVLGDALSFLVSAASLIAVRTREAVVSDRSRDVKGLVRGMREGWICVWQNVVLRAIAMTNSGFFLAFAIVNGIFTVFAVRVLDLSPLGIGLIAASSGVGGTIGTLAAPPIAKRLSISHSIRVSALCRAALLVGVPLAVLDRTWALEWLMAVRFALGFAWSVFSISQLTVRQTAVRSGMLSNVTAVKNFLTRGMGPVGALMGGLLAQALSVTAAIAIGAAVGGIAGLLVLLPARPHPQKAAG